MSQYPPNPYAYSPQDSAEQSAPPAPPKVSALAIASLVCSLFICCPIVTLVGPFLGLSAIISISAHPMERRGKGIALAGIIIGIITTAAWGGGIYFAGLLTRGMLDFADHDVATALDDGFAGDFNKFRLVLTSDSAQQATDGTIQTFLDELTARYGAFSDVNISDSLEGFETENNRVTMPVELEFAGGKTVSGRMEFILESVSADGWRLHSITIPDRDRGDLRFP